MVSCRAKVRALANQKSLIVNRQTLIKGATYLLSALSILLLTACPPQPTLYNPPAADTDFIYERHLLDSLPVKETINFTHRDRTRPEQYYPDTTQLQLLPMRHVRVNVHLMNTTDTLYKYYGRVGADYARQVIGACNELLRERPELWLKPDGVDVPAVPRRLRVELAQDPETGEDAIYDHFDDQLYAYQHKGKGQNRGDRRPVKKYAVRTGEEINLFIMGPPRDSLLKKSYRRPGSNGVFVGNAIKITGWMSNDRPFWDHRFVIVHEILHALGLSHAWGRDGCDDTPVHNNDCWARSSSPRCDTMTSNNIMDYSNRQVALTPCQIGRVHARLSTPGSRQRGYLRRDWCDYDPTKPIEIEADHTIEGQRDYRSDIFIRRGAKLRINNRVHLAEGAYLYVDPGSTLELGPLAVLHNDCGGQWGGIKVGRTANGYAGRVVTEPGAVVRNVAP